MAHLVKHLLHNHEDPQHTMKSQAQLCVSAVPVPGRQRWRGSLERHLMLRLSLASTHARRNRHTINQYTLVRLFGVQLIREAGPSCCHIGPKISTWSDLFDQPIQQRTSQHMGAAKSPEIQKIVCGSSLDLLGRKLGKARSQPQ